jgi:hypothetical protein
MKLSHEEKLAYFDATRVVHSRVQMVMSMLEAHTRPFSGNDITLLIGPTGVGKTTMSGSFYERTLQSFAARMEEDRGLIPIVRLEAPATGEIQFSHRVFYTKILAECQFPPLKQDHSDLDFQRVALTAGHLRGTVASLRLNVESALEGRRCKIIVIDEAFHLVGNGGSRLAAQMDGLKSLSNVTEVKIVLVGSYDLLPILEINGQLARRCSPIHIARYHRDVEEDCVEFGNLLSKLCRLMPLDLQPKLDGYVDELMRACVGLPGLLKETLQRALNYALIAGVWTESCLERALPTKNVSKAILAECLKGEVSLQKWESGSGVFEDFSTGDDREAA